METLEGIKVLHISCGQTHTVAIVESLENLDEEEEEEEEMEEIDEGEVTKFEDTTTTTTTTTTKVDKVDNETVENTMEIQKETTTATTKDETEQSDEVDEKTSSQQQETTTGGETKKEVEYKSASLDPDYTAPPSEKSNLSKDMDPYKVCGYLNKKGDKGIVKSWKKRWFQINEDVIGYYEQEDVSQVFFFFFIIQFF